MMSETISLLSSETSASKAKILKTGIIGAGRMGITHLSLMATHPSLKPVAICDDSTMITRSLARYRPDIRLFEDFHKMLAEQQLDVIFIATPPHLHAPMISASLDRNLSIFVEKPFTLNTTEAMQLVAQSRGSKGAHQVGYVNRFNDVFIKVKGLLEQDVIGRLISFRSDMYGCTVIRKGSGSGWRAKRETGGGCLYEFGSHAIDLMVYLFGKPDRVVGSCLKRIYSSEVDDMFYTHALYNNGLIGSVNVNWSDESYRKPTNKIEVLGEKGKILADQHGLKLFLNREQPPYVKGWNTVYITDIFTPVPFYVRGSEFSRQIHHFAERALDHSQPNLSSFEDGAATQAVMDMVFADASECII